jgi:hypothetical protein
MENTLNGEITISTKCASILVDNKKFFYNFLDSFYSTFTVWDGLCQKPSHDTVPLRGGGRRYIQKVGLGKTAERHVQKIQLWKNIEM